MTQDNTTPTPGWEERFKNIAWHMKYEDIGLDPYPVLAEFKHKGLITMNEYERSIRKISLIEPFFKQMVLNMIEGTVKYPHDDWSTETRQKMGMDDKADSINYSLLMEDHLRKENKL